MVVLLTACSSILPEGLPGASAKPVEIETWGQAVDNQNQMVLYAAEAMGFLEQSGAVVKRPYAITNSSPILIQGLTAGTDITIGPGATDSAILAIDKGAGIKIIGAFVYAAPYSLIVSPGINKIEDLKGKTCGASTLTGVDALVLNNILGQKGLQMGRDYTVVLSGNIVARVQSMQQNQTQCTALAAPQDIQLESMGMKIIARAADSMGNYQFISLIANTAWAQAHRDTVVKLIKGLKKGGAWVYQPENKEKLKAILVERAQVPAEFAEGTYQNYLVKAQVAARELKNNPDGVLEVIKAMKAVDAYPKEKTPNISDYVDNSYWEEASR